MTEPQRRHANVVNVDEIKPSNELQGDFVNQRRRLGPEAGGRALGCTLIEVPPGKTAYPYHFHSAFEESIYVLEGRGSLRIGKDKVDVRAGDYVGIPAGPEFAHALTNTGEATLRYLCM